MVTFELFGKPAIRRLRGEQHPFPRVVDVVTDDEVSIAAPLMHFFRVTLASDAAGALHARLTGPQGSGLLTSMARADALLVVPLEQFGRGPVPPGMTLRALPLGESAMLGAELAL
jgi:molybdopterin molybdotransferase